MGEEHLFDEGEPHSVLLDVERDRPLRTIELLDADGRPVTHRDAYVRKVATDGERAPVGRRATRHDKP